MMKLLICLSLIVLPLIAGAEVREPPGCWKRIRTVSIYDEYAQYAVRKHNEMTKENIVFVRILSGKLQLDYGTRYYFIMEGKNGDDIIFAVNTNRNLPEISTVLETMNTENNQNQNQTFQSKVISHAFSSGTIKQSLVFSSLGLLDIGASENAYIFRVQLPGTGKNQNKIKCEIQRDGRVIIQGVVPETRIASESGCLYRMQVHQSCPPGPFSIGFNLPGPVDPRLFSPTFKPFGVLEVVVVKLGVRIPPP
ncbi:unnamed protein product [Microthlaspi erraticum]|uniref:Cystatin domain-containing protein n=1 Tax=Microthlaspi erraticum TaxID=1685480 RepID=A0A6D2K1I5_9BRAS|nr:unnamed protein product [Microthlaspi erraticum]CAA7052530.1 unnamed protein product [Microthlaspi erraticum]